jgi:hypothetical protein
MNSLAVWRLAFVVKTNAFFAANTSRVCKNTELSKRAAQVFFVCAALSFSARPS